MILTNCKIFNGIKFIVENTVKSDNGLITAVYYSVKKPEGSVDLGGKILSPGLIDMHTHAAAKLDFLSVRTKNDIIKIKKAYLNQGVTSFLATTLYSAKDKNRMKTIRGIQKIKTGARCLGVYLESPFINPARKGAIREMYIYKGNNPELEIKRVLKNYPLLRVMTVAPELTGAERVIKYLKSKNITAAFGHSDAGSAQALHGIKWGITHVTHLFNGMRKIHDGDVPFKAILADRRVMIELIADGRHVPPDIMRIVYKKFGRGRIVLISDATGAKTFYGAAREIGTNLPLIELVRRMKKICGLGTEEALQMATYNPAKVLKIKAGQIKSGFRAEFVVLDNTLNVKRTIK